MVVEFEFALHPAGTRALVAEHTFGAGHAAAALRAWRDLAAGAPRPATFTASIRDGQATAGFVWVGDPRRGRRLAEQLEALGEPLTRRVAETSYLGLQRREDTPAGPRRCAATGRATTCARCPTRRSARCCGAARTPRP